MATGDIFQDMLAQVGLPAWAFTLILIWTLVWKAFALWISARKSQKAWFVVLLVLNTLGILEILYIFLFSKIKLDGKKPAKRRK